MAITPITLLQAGPNSLEYLVGEDNNAANTVQRDVAADLVAGPLSDLLTPAFANQAAAQAAIQANCDIVVYRQASATAGATGAANLVTNPNVSGAGAGNFRLDLTGVKAANGDTATYIVRLIHRHSMIR